MPGIYHELPSLTLPSSSHNGDSLRSMVGTNVLIYSLDQPFDDVDEKHMWGVRLITDGGKYSLKQDCYVWKVQCSLKMCGANVVLPLRSTFYFWYDFDNNSINIDERYNDNLRILFEKSGKIVLDWIDKMVHKKLLQQKTLTITPIIDESPVPNSILWFLQNSNHLSKESQYDQLYN